MTQPTSASRLLMKPQPADLTPKSRRAFDIDEALERALQVFWRKGYEGASLSDLMDAMGINRPSLYAAFGNKEDLFRKALGRYLAGPVAYIGEAIGQPTARQVVEQLLLKSADFLTNPKNPRGCLAVHGALSCSSDAATIREELNKVRRAYENAMRRRFKKAKSKGDLPATSNPADLARYVATILQGMAVQAVGGATRKDLRRIVELVLRSWPS